MIKLDHCPVCGESRGWTTEGNIIIHSHPGITISNLTHDYYDDRKGLIFSYEGMIAQLRMLGYLVPA